MRSSSTLRRFLAERRGNVATMGVVLMPVLLGATAFAVDQGALYNERRSMQRLTDLAAIAAASDIANAEAAAQAVFAANGQSNIKLITTPSDRSDVMLGSGSRIGWMEIQKGVYEPSPGRDVNDRFVATSDRPNAVRIQHGKIGERYFASSLLPAFPISTEATASATAKTAISVGSRLAALNGGIVNALLSGLLGSNISLSVMDYEALLSTDLDLLRFLDALAIDLNLTAGTYKDLLDTEVTVGRIAKVLAKVGPNSRVKAALTAISDKAAANIKLPLSKVISLGDFGGLQIGQPNGFVALTVGVMEMLTASAAVANGKHQIALDLGAQVPGLLGLTAQLAIGEPPQSTPWFAVGDAGTIVRTAQTRLLLEAKVGGQGVLAGIGVHLPIYLEVAYAEAKVASVSCNPQAVKVQARPGILDLRIGKMNVSQLKDFSRTPTFSKATLVDALLVSVKGEARVNAGNQNWATLTFNASDISKASVKQASTYNLLGSLTKSLTDDLDLQINILGLGLGLGPVQSALNLVLGGLAPALDTVIFALLDTLGIKLGQADVRVHGVVCQRPVLVQ